MKLLCLAGLVLCLAVPMLGASTALSAPVVVIYPYVGTSGIDADAGGKLAVVMATQLSQYGDLNITPATPGTDRAQFLAAARAVGADYYVTGYLTPLGTEVSLVSQVVSVATGILVWSNTEEISTYGEASGQADAIHQAILQHAGRAFASIDEPPSATSPPRNQEPGNIVQAFGRHGSHETRPRSSPSPFATPSAPAASAVASRSGHVSKRRRSKPARPLASPPAVALATALPSATVTVIVVMVGGDATAGQRARAATTLTDALGRTGLQTSREFTMTSDDMPDRAPRACQRATGSDIYSGTLSLQFAGGGSHHSTDATFNLLRYDCSGNVISSQRAEVLTSGHDDVDEAIDRVVAASLPTVLNPPRQHSAL
jgi:TolB-like protein